MLFALPLVSSFPFLLPLFSNGNLVHPFFKLGFLCITTIIINLPPPTQSCGGRSMMAAIAYSSSYNSPCAACKFLRRKCLPDCIYAPYFPPEEPHKFANVHKIFGAGNVSKLLKELLPHQREDAVSSLAYEAEARIRDPIYGCVGAITFLQKQVERLQKELDAAKAELIRLTCIEAAPVMNIQGTGYFRSVDLGRARWIMGGDGVLYHGQPGFPVTYSFPWNDGHNNNNNNNNPGSLW